MSQYVPNIDDEMHIQPCASDEIVRKINIFCSMIGIGCSVSLATRGSKAGFAFFHIAVADLLLCFKINIKSLIHLHITIIIINRPTIGNVLNGIEMPVSCNIQGFLRYKQCHPLLKHNNIYKTY